MHSVAGPTSPKRRYRIALPDWGIGSDVVMLMLVVGVAVGIAVPVSIAVLSGAPLFGTTDRAAVEPTSARPSAAMVSRPVPGGLGASTPTPTSTAKPTPTATAKPTPTATAKPTAKPTPRPTLDKKRPTITSRNPGPGAVGVAMNRAIRIVFSEPVRNASGATIQLVNVEAGWTVRSTVVYDAAKRTATLAPVLGMYPNTDYRVTILAGITDRAGNRLKPTSWTFRVGS